VTSIDPQSSLFLNTLGRLQDRIDRAQRQLSSGMRVELASDDPAAIVDLLDMRTTLQRDLQIRANLEQEKTEVDTAESVLRQAVELVEEAIALGAKGAGTLATPEQRTQFGDQVANLHERMVALSQTKVNDRYVFSGDSELVAQYAADPLGMGGVLRLHTAAATRRTPEPGGTYLVTGSTAQEIFDARNPDDTAATDNVFVALWSLATELRADNDAGIGAAIDSLKASNTRVNDYLSRYGSTQERLTRAIGISADDEVRDRAEISRLADADLAFAATELSQASLHENAAMAAQAGYRRESLFAYLK
jgi:flagellar hook-associated protein 3 FlgL